MAAIDIKGTIVISSINQSSKTGCNTLTQLNGTVASCQGDGTIQDRPAGTDGDYEQCQVTGLLAVFLPKSGIANPQPFVFAIAFGSNLL